MQQATSAGKRQRRITIGFTSDWLEKWREGVWPIKSAGE